ncbi:attractin-like protein 1 isoform X2 [Mya arenaria]|uniref:attractin-like protein 1 isoform X2 n=1 Tax=Mya arenaria TaxID=6604 RepID=UPI0022E3C7D5|nr:attractin-like protein 1 isoform X2 [Mya arenaria]
MAEKNKLNTFSTNLDNFQLQTQSKLILLVLIFCYCAISNVECVNKCGDTLCENGSCEQNNTVCVCEPGWSGPSCSRCVGRIRLTSTNGVVTDGSGNYSVDNKCMWLIEPNPPGAPLRLATHQFATECGWDHLYIFNGDSVFSPLIAAYSGLVSQELDVNNSFTELVADSGKAYIYFYSDAAYNMSGFHLKYRVGECPKNCSGNGLCNNDTMQCMCFPGYRGDHCHVEECPNNCSANGRCEDSVCVCEDGFKGVDCSIPLSSESWIRHSVLDAPAGRASAASILVGEELCVSGGYAFGKEVDFLVGYNITSHEWKRLPESSTVNPKFLYGHSMVRYKDELFVYGGVSSKHIESFLWTYNIATYMWSSQDFNVTRAVAGHSAVLIGSKMYVIFGHSPIYGYMNKVQVMDLDSPNRTFTTVQTQGARIKGGYGHTSVLYGGEIYVYGGYIAGVSGTQYSLTDRLYSFNPVNSTWKILASSGSPRYLHSAVFLGELMLIFGGNTHNDTSISYGAKCYSPDFMAYDPKCNSWSYLNKAELLPDSARYGHIAQPYTDEAGAEKMLIFGGFDGVMLNDIMEYESGTCSLDNGTVCSPDIRGRVCVCTYNSSTLVGREDRKIAEQLKSSELITHYVEPQCTVASGREEFCRRQNPSCGSCLSSPYGCKWCSNNCTTVCPEDTKYEVTNASECLSKYNNLCSSVKNCHACSELEDCRWSKDKDCFYKDRSSFEGVSTLMEFHEKMTENDTLSEPVCDAPCYTYNSCENCTKNTCMWCGSQERCVETNSYVASFLYGQCQEWVTSSVKCTSTRCSDLHTCEDCKTNPACGWCNDVSNTGLGKCVQGSARGPATLNNVTLEYELNSNTCPAERWFFIECPLCQCNGHSSCTNVSDQCDACQNLTTGDHCEQCIQGYHGNPRNGGNCTACSCNGQAENCNSETGACFCRTRGVKGHNCNVCDTDNNYFGNPNNGGTCYYDLRTDYQFTFNLSKNDDKHYTGINFMNIPQANDRDVDFTLNCSGAAYINITYKSRSHPQEQFLTKNYMCTLFRSKFEHKDYNFGPDDNVTFYVYVYGFATPFWLQISFSQFPKIDLVHFFVTFFSCFLSLLIIAAVLYKIKHKYDSYRRRQRLMVEMEEMASRPFAATLLEVEQKSDQAVAEKKDTGTELRKRKRGASKPSQIALEPLHNQKAAVLSLFIQLPCGDEEWAPPGISGLSIGSTLISIGHQRKTSVEFPKGDKTKHHKKFNIHDTNV